MANYITVDSGTTNTRISLFANGKIAYTVHKNIGAQKSVDGNLALKKALHDGIAEIFTNNNITKSDIVCILACGMITSEFGLCNLAHITAPAGIAELHQSMRKAVIDDVSDIPFYFVHGIKTNGKTLETSDMMRGEECEIIGIADSTNSADVFVLPGSHSKIIKTDHRGRITDFSTTLTGEMIFALSQNTILKDAVDLQNAQLNTKFLIDGFDYAKNVGINEALFKVRVLKNILNANTDETYSFFLGSILSAEIEKIISLKPKCVAVGGKAQIKTAICEILNRICTFSTLPLPDSLCSTATAYGMVKIFEYTI